MGELIDVACDICGQIYHWSDERLGEIAACRECGTKFEVMEYIPPPDPDDAAMDNPLPWVKGGGVAAVIVLAVFGLGRLLFYRPGGDTTFAAASSQQMQTTQSDPIRARMQRSFRNVRTSTPPATSPTLPPGPTGLPPGFAPRRSIPPAPAPPVSSAHASPPGVLTGVPPVVTGWVMSGVPILKLHVTGRGFRGVTAVQVGGGVSLNNVSFSIVSDSELAINSGFAMHPQAVTMISSPDGMVVIFHDSAKTADAQTNSSVTTAADVVLVRNNGRFTSPNPVLLLVESGGSAEIASFAFIAFVKQNGRLTTSSVNILIAEPGAQITLKQPPRTEVRPRVLTFCPLPKPVIRP